MSLRVVIVGAGFSGAALAVQLLRRTRCAVTLIEASGVFGRGLAYSTPEPVHLLNVRAGRMSLFPDAPDHFVRWLAAEGRGGDAQAFAPRADYGDYLQAVLGEAEAAAPGRLRRVRGRAVAVRAGPAGADVELDGGRAVRGDAVVLATGNGAPAPLDTAGAEALGARHVGDPWAPGALDAVGPDEDVVLVGAGLTMVDVMLSLERRGWRGRALAVSRHGLLPRTHAPVEVEREGPPPGGEGLAGRLRAFREAAAAEDWRVLTARLRPHLQTTWRRASAKERRRFLRHLRPYWDVHRHRTAPEVGARIQALIDAGRLEVAAGRPLSASPQADGFELRWRRRGGGEETRRAQRLINCTGPRGDPSRSEDPLLRGLIAAGVARPDRHRLGLDVDARRRVLDAEGRAQPRLFAMGPLTRGAFWEIVAVPDIRGQAAAMAETLGALSPSRRWMDALFLSHPREVGEGYWDHLATAGVVGGRLLLAGAACVTHAFVPALFPRTASQTIHALHAEITARNARRIRSSANSAAGAGEAQRGEAACGGEGARPAPVVDRGDEGRQAHPARGGQTL
jgi:uncharacterized NAD(P)/FAD-binding protein YdhS